MGEGSKELSWHHLGRASAQGCNWPHCVSTPTPPGCKGTPSKAACTSDSRGRQGFQAVPSAHQVAASLGCLGKEKSGLQQVWSGLRAENRETSLGSYCGRGLGTGRGRLWFESSPSAKGGNRRLSYRLVRVWSTMEEGGWGLKAISSPTRKNGVRFLLTHVKIVETAPQSPMDTSRSFKTYHVIFCCFWTVSFLSPIRWFWDKP